MEGDVSVVMENPSTSIVQEDVVIWGRTITMMIANVNQYTRSSRQ